MHDPSAPPEIPKQSLAPVWIGAGAAVAIGGAVWALARAPQKDSKPELVGRAAPAAAEAAVAAAGEPRAAPPPPLLRSEHALPPPPPVGSIPAEVAAPPAAGPARRDPNCDDPCRGRETAELLSSLRAKASQARSCYERALSNDSALAGKLEVALRVGADGTACAASVAGDTLRDAAVTSCALARLRSAKYPAPSGGCVDVSVPMNFMPVGSR